ncbi:MAG: tetratricopeptide repeat protein [Acidobacteriota bacterium]
MDQTLNQEMTGTDQAWERRLAGQPPRRFTIALLSCFSILVSAVGSLPAQQIDKYVRQASKLVERYQLDDALSLLEIGLRQYPDAPELLLQMGSLLVHVGQAERGEGLLQRALAIEPFNPEILRTSAQAKLRQGRLASAIELFRKSLWHGSGDAESHHLLAYSLFLQGDEEKALDHARRSVRIEPLSAPYRDLYSLLLDLHGDQKESDRQLRMAHRLEPNDAHILYRLSRRQRREKRLGQALEYAELASNLDPENPLYFRELGDLYKQMGETQLAREAMVRSHALEESFQKYLSALQLSGQGRIDEAIRILEATVSQQPSFITGMMQLAYLYQKQEKPDQALGVYRRVLELNPSLTAAREQGAWIQARKGSLKQALELLRDSRDRSINESILQGYQLLVRKDWSGALKHLRQVESENPLTPGILGLLAYCLSQLGESEEALRYLATAERLQPGDTRIRAQISEVKLDQALQFQAKRQWARALEIYQVLVRSDGRKPVYLFNMAYCQQQIGELSQAVAHYRAGLALDSQADWARINLASCLYRSSRFEEAAAEWGILLGRTQTPESYLQLGLCYSQLHRDAEAEVVFEKAMVLGDRSPQVVYNLGITRLRLMKQEEAWALIRRAALLGYQPARKLLQQARR